MADLKANTTIGGRHILSDIDDLIARIGKNEDLNTQEKATIILAINELYQKFNNHTDEKANDNVHGLLTGGHIIEDSGRNENGTYIRYSNGFQICFFSETSYTTIEGNTNVSKTYTFPAAFVEGATVVGTIDSSSFMTSTFWRVYNRTGSSFLVTIFNEATNIRNITFNYLAMGRWK